MPQELPLGLKSEVLKVAHHGSKNSSSEDFLRAVSSTDAVISVALKNSYGHPSIVVTDELKNLVDTGKYPTPINIEMHVGSEDWQSSPDSVKAIANKLNITYSIVPNEGHSLSKKYVGKVLDTWLTP